MSMETEVLSQTTTLGTREVQEPSLDHEQDESLGVQKRKRSESPTRKDSSGADYTIGDIGGQSVDDGNNENHKTDNTRPDKEADPSSSAYSSATTAEPTKRHRTSDPILARGALAQFTKAVKESATDAAEASKSSSIRERIMAKCREEEAARREAALQKAREAKLQRQQQIEEKLRAQHTEYANRLANFIPTSTMPVLFWKPAVPSAATEILLRSATSAQLRADVIPAFVSPHDRANLMTRASSASSCTSSSSSPPSSASSSSSSSSSSGESKEVFVESDSTSSSGSSEKDTTFTNILHQGNHNNIINKDDASDRDNVDERRSDSSDRVVDRDAHS